MFVMTNRQLHHHLLPQEALQLVQLVRRLLLVMVAQYRLELQLLDRPLEVWTYHDLLVVQ